MFGVLSARFGLILWFALRSKIEPTSMSGSLVLLGIAMLSLETIHVVWTKFKRSEKT